MSRGCFSRAGVTRRRTLAVCAALGAGRGRLARQLLTESMALSLGGGVLGLAAAAFVLRAAPALVPIEVARLDAVGVDAVVLVFTVGLSIAVGLLIGAAPVFEWSRVRLVPALNEGGAQSAGGFRLLRSNRARAALATVQVALTLVLLIGAGPRRSYLHPSGRTREPARPGGQRGRSPAGFSGASRQSDGEC